MTAEPAHEPPLGHGNSASPECDEGCTDSAADAGPVADVSKAAEAEHATLKYSLLGPSLTKAGQDSVDQSKVRGRSLPNWYPADVIKA